ncbi:class I adenylate-forming enzyme family protein [Nocardioides sp. TF02-7]|uniref:class I adenylate-forming enzyme family protein n=1 Tax=Nocardioides sp. TF02-7 TaxID=2917724 RepID=UPI001F06321A|nr:class I adenylate-forming enzyme family protein [Nocardioides sp. TF02-7]UMG91307.1 acyl--CoA ligase [Nocardioides sp. TF02-7]
MHADYHAILRDAAERWPDRVALASGEEELTYAEVHDAAERLAEALSARGIGPGARVALCLGNEPAWVFAFFALCRLRASAVMLSTAWREREIEHALAVTRPVAVVAGPAQAEVLEAAGRPELAVLSSGSRPGWTGLPDLLDGPRPVVPDDVRRLDPSELELALPFSSGTTGMPKAVRHTHRSLLVATQQWRASLDVGPDDRLQALTPLAHILGIVNVGATFLGGAWIRLFARFSPRSMVDSFEADRITIGMTVAPIAAALDAMADLDQRDLGSLRYLNWSATPVNEELAARVTARTGVGWVTAYGTTEVPVLAAHPVDHGRDARLDTVGLPPEGVEVEARDPATGAFLPRGETGELVARSPAAMAGYLPEPEVSPFVDGGWYRTGDIGHVEPEGWVVVTDRLKDLIKVSGFQVSPVEIENVLMMSPLVADCAVYGVSDERRGEVPCAAVVPADGWTPDAAAILDWLEPQLSSYKALREVVFVDAIPRTPSGKIQRRRLTGTDR